MHKKSKAWVNELGKIPTRIRDRNGPVHGKMSRKKILQTAHYMKTGDFIIVARLHNGVICSMRNETGFKFVQEDMDDQLKITRMG